MNYGIESVPVAEGTCPVKISIDAGSTETRSHIWDTNPKSGTTYGIDSGYSILTQDISGLKSQSETLYDNMEITLEDLTPEKEDKVFEQITVIKGGIFEDMRLPAAKTNSNTGKGLQDTTYINAIANIGLRVYMAAQTTGRAYTEYRMKVTLALPNEDIASTKRQEDAKNRLAGNYYFTLPRCNFATNITIAKDDILLIDEAQAALASWRQKNKDSNTSYDNVLLIDAGGRSIDYSLMLKGRVLARGSLTGKYGGQKFVDSIIEKYMNETGNDSPTKDMIYEALDSGKMQDGNAKIEIVEFIDMAKREIAATINNDITSLLDSNEVRMTQLNLVVGTGRLMGETTQDGEVVVDSLIKYIESYVKKASANTVVGRLDDSYALVHGLSLARFAFDSRKK